MSRPETRSRTRNRNEPEPNPLPREEPKQESNTSTVSHNKNSNHKSTVSSKNTCHSIILLRKREAELAAAKRLLQLERTIVEKELQVELARLSAQGTRLSVSDRPSRSRVQEWLTSELDNNYQEEPLEPSIPDEHTQTCQPERNDTAGTGLAELTNIQLLAREISKLRKPTEGNELPFYNGSVHEWLSFKAAYVEISSTLTCTELVSRLRRCLKGEARETIAALLYSQVPASEIMEALELRFGRPELILLEEVRALKDLPKLSDSTEQLSKFACKVRNCVATIKALNRPEHLHNIELVQTLKLKMPHLKSRWITYAIEHEHEDEPELIKLSNFLKKEAQSVSKYWTHEPLRLPTHSNRAHYTEKEEYDEDTDHCYATCQRPFIELAETPCPYCKSTNHSFLKDCDKFIPLSIDDRWKWAKEAKVCFKCLKPRHRRETCRAKSCGVDGCRMTHSCLLHSPIVQPAVKTEPPTALEPQVEKLEPKSITIACCKTTPNAQVLLKIIPVDIHGPLSSKRTYALLDEGSTSTLLKQELARSIGLTGEIEPLTLVGVNSTSAELNSERVDLKITGPSYTPIELFGARTVQNLPLSPQTIGNVRQYSYLRDLPEAEICYNDALPELLIGQDNWHAIVGREIRHGLRNEPVASLTALGWVIHGCYRTSVVSDNHVLNTRELDGTKISKINKQKKMYTQNLPDIVNTHTTENKRVIKNTEQTKNTIKKEKILKTKKLKHQHQTDPPNYYTSGCNETKKNGFDGSCKSKRPPKKWYLPYFGVQTGDPYSSTTMNVQKSWQTIES